MLLQTLCFIARVPFKLYRFRQNSHNSIVYELHILVKSIASTTRSSINVNPAPLFTDLIFLIVFIWSGNFTILNIYIMENWCWINPNHFGKLKVVLKSVERRAGSRDEGEVFGTFD